METQTLKAVKLLIAGGALLSVCFYVGNAGTPIAANNQVNTIEIASVNARLVSSGLNTDEEKILASLPNSLQGVDTNIKLSTDSSGELVVNQALRDMFEVFLSVLGEEPLEIIVFRIQKNLNEQLKNPALDQALSLLDNYIAYRQELVDIQAYINEQSESLTQAETFNLRQEKIKTLRDQFFDEAAYQGFFGKEDQYDQFLFSQLAINQNIELTQQEKRQQLSALENTLPEEVVRVRKSASQYGKLHYEVAELQESGASSEEIYQARSKALGNEAAMLLSNLDEKRNVWNKQIDEYKRYKQTIVESSLSAEDQQLSLQTWLDGRFNELEQLRVKAITASL